MFACWSRLQCLKQQIVSMEVCTDNNGTQKISLNDFVDLLTFLKFHQEVDFFRGVLGEIF